MNLLPLLTGAAALLFCSCVPNTPEQRIVKNIAVYTSLPAKHQELVKRGELARGMSPEAVFIAWGKPTERYQGLNGGESTERWDYTRNRPVYTNQVGFGFGQGFGFGRGCGYGGGFNSLFISPEVTYIPQRSASVLFKKNKVDAWERMQ
jgi:hypothetical protein